KGRKKDLIVLANGQNVYPEDIESELGRHPAVTEGVVLGIDKPGGVVEVHAVLLMQDASRAEEAVIEANTHLADHQRVQAFTVWPFEDFPRTHTLKVKKRDVLEKLQELLASGGELALPPASPLAGNLLYRLISELGTVAPQDIESSSKLGIDLNLDSLGRVELLSAIEGETCVYFDEAGV